MGCKTSINQSKVAICECGFEEFPHLANSPSLAPLTSSCFEIYTSVAWRVRNSIATKNWN